MDAISLISQDLFDKVRSRFANLEMGDEDGNVITDPRQARFFDFDFVQEGNNLGRVSISINERGALKLFYSKGILEEANPIAQDLWFDFLREMRQFAKRRLLRFDTRDITKSNLDKTDFQYLASTGTKEDTMAESKMFGSSKSSYLTLERARLIVRHSKPVEEEQRGSRSRNIKALYIENAEGERFKYPFIHLAGAKAMQRHVANGGRPYDDYGKAIVQMSEQIAQLTAFKRHVGRPDSMQSEAHDIVERANIKLEQLRNQMESICKQRHYEVWKESFSPISNDDEGMILDQATMETYKNTFTINSFKEDLAQYFPLIHKIMQETSEVDLASYVKETSDDADETEEAKATKEGFAAFEDWANSLIEGKPGMDQIGELANLLSTGLTLGVDGTSAIEALEGIGIRDEELQQALEGLAKIDPDADPKQTILTWLNKYDPASAAEMGFNTQTTQEPSGPPEGSQVPYQEPTADQNVSQNPYDQDDLAPMEDENGDDEKVDDDYEMPVEGKPVTLRQIAEMVKSFYDKETGKFPLGETGVITKVRKELGDRAGELAERLINSLKENNPRSDDMFEDILKLAGLKK